MCDSVALPFYMKKYLKAKEENYGNSNISPCKNIIFKKSSKTNQNIILQDIIITLSYILNLQVCLSVCPGSFQALPGPLFFCFFFFFFDGFCFLCQLNCSDLCFFVFFVLFCFFFFFFMGFVFCVS